LKNSNHDLKITRTHSFS